MLHCLRKTWPSTHASAEMQHLQPGHLQDLSSQGLPKERPQLQPPCLLHLHNAIRTQDCCAWKWLPPPHTVALKIWTRCAERLASSASPTRSARQMPVNFQKQFTKEEAVAFLDAGKTALEEKPAGGLRLPGVRLLNQPHSHWASAAHFDVKTLMENSPEILADARQLATEWEQAHLGIIAEPYREREPRHVDSICVRAGAVWLLARAGDGACSSGNLWLA